LSAALKLDSLKDLADLALGEAQKLGASYAEARIHGSRERGYLLKNGEAQPSIIAESNGIGIRVICDGALAFAATNFLDSRSVRELANETVKVAKASSKLTTNPVLMDNSRAVEKKWRAEEKKRIESADATWLRRILIDIDKTIKGAGRDVKIPNRILTAVSSVEEKYFVNTDGARVESRVPRLLFLMVMTAIQGGQTVQRTVQQGETGGTEIAKRIDIVGKAHDEAKALRQVLLKASKPPTGKLDVILSPELSGIAAHESVGHPQEADRILGREGAQAGESYLLRESLGTVVGSKEANVSDDPTLLHSNGYNPVDDEGVETRKRKLIQKGVVSEYLENRSTAAELKERNNASSRAAGFNREPIIRMSNTFVEPGDFTTEELIKEVREGIYMKSFTEWNIDDKRLNQRYVGMEAYLIKNGEIKNLVRSPVLEITTPRLWGSVKARGKRMEFEAATCGKGDPMQGIPVWTGGPDTLLAGIELGSR
jgi:TldD protein